MQDYPRKTAQEGEESKAWIWVIIAVFASTFVLDAFFG